MKNNGNVPSATESERYSYREIGSFICLLSGVCTWRFLSDYAFPALGHGVKVAESLILS
jgi:hypothetical protein